MSKPSDNRKHIQQVEIELAVEEVANKLWARLTEKGYGTWLSRHEVLGFLTEEYHEAVEAVHSGSLTAVKEELKDIAVGCIIAIACINEQNMEW